MLLVSSRVGVHGCVRLLKTLVCSQKGFIAQLILQILCCTLAKDQHIVQGTDGLAAMMADEVELEVLQPDRLSDCKCLQGHNVAHSGAAESN